MAARISRHPAPESPAGAPARVADRYELIRPVARGGMGIVYLVRDELSGEERALKRVSLRDPRHRDVYRAAFEREYQVLASLDHPRIVRVFEYGVDHEGPYYTMEFVRGQDLRKDVPRPWREVCSLLRDVASSLALLHARRLVYRDLNPGNVKLTTDLHCKLLDFGALTDFGRQKWLIGAPPCIPPEALADEPLDQRADLFALGSLAYWALTGRHAYPASDIESLTAVWRELPQPPSAWTLEVPEALDDLVMSLLRIDRLARPGSAAEVIAKLSVIGRLPPEGGDERRRVAQSFLTVPPFVGRSRELAKLERHVRAAMGGQGGSLRISAPAGAGRTRLLDEVALRAQLAGATALRVDASMHPGANGTARALVVRLLDLLPDLATACAEGHRTALHALGDNIQMRLPEGLAPVVEHAGAGSEALWAWFVAVSRQRPLVIGVDSVELCDDESAGLIAALIAHASDAPLAVVTVERDDYEMPRASETLRTSGELLRFGHLARDEMRLLARSLFGETPHVERFGEWLHDRSAGSPLHALELVRHMVAREVIRYEAGYWVLPVRHGEAEVALPEALEAALSLRLAGLRPEALALAQALAMLRIEPSLALCRRLLARSSPSLSEAELEAHTVALLDELAQQAVLMHEHDSYRFGSSAMREAALASIDAFPRLAHHVHLGDALESLAGEGDMVTLLEAGWHLMQGGQELRGAQLVASVMSGSFRLHQLGLASYPLGPVSARALGVFTRQRRSTYERVPLLGAVSQAILHDNFALFDRHADEVLDVLEDVTGMRLARRLSRFLGRFLGLCVGLTVAALRFGFVPKRERSYSFKELIGQLGNCVCMFTGAAALSLDAERAEHVARTIDPFKGLPEVSTLRAVQFLCEGSTLLTRERQADAFAIWSKMVVRFDDPSTYPLLPPSDRAMCVATARYGRAGTSVFRVDGGTSLEDAAVLEASGLRAYAMVVPHLRYLHYALRGELTLAAPYRAEIEQQGVDGAVAWHAELWTTAAHLLVHLGVGDLMGVTHVAHRLEELARMAPSLAFYHRLAELTVMLAREDIREANVEMGVREIETRAPRSFLGWSMLVALTARIRNRQGRHAEARALCERALATMSDADRDFVGLFLQVDIETAIADAGLGKVGMGLERLDGLLHRYAPSGHPLALGLLHEARAQIALGAGRFADYQASLAEVERRFRATGTPGLIAKIERLAALQRPVDKSRARSSQQTRDSTPISTLATVIEHAATTENNLDVQTETDLDGATRAERRRD